MVLFSLGNLWVLNFYLKLMLLGVCCLLFIQTLKKVSSESFDSIQELFVEGTVPELVEGAVRILNTEC